MRRVSYPLTASLAAFIAVLFAAGAAVAMPPPPGPAWPSYIPPAQQVSRPVTNSTSTPLWPYLVVAIAAVLATLAVVALVRFVRHHSATGLRTA